MEKGINDAFTLLWDFIDAAVVTLWDGLGNLIELPFEFVANLFD